jgi:hypothetical protein
MTQVIPGGTTTEYRLDLEAHRTVANGDVAAGFPATNSDNLETGLALRIKREARDDGPFEFMLFGGRQLKPGEFFLGYSNRSEADVFAAVEECREEWKQGVVDLERAVEREGKPDHEWPFQARWNFQEEPQLLAAVAPRLALAGHKLFTSVFELACDDDLPKLAAKVREVLHAPCCIAINSADFFIPWSMLYTQPPDKEPLAIDGSNWDLRGFWGYSHIVQQSPRQINLEGRIVPGVTGDLPFSVNYDDRLPITLDAKIGDHIRMVSKLAGSACVKRTKKGELAIALTRDRPKLERILYFYCHGHGSSSAGSASTGVPRLSLKDGDVKASDFELWAKGAPPTGALIIINACQGGQMTTLFYKSFAQQLLKEGAVGLIGAQIDVPAVFASAYGELLLQQFMARGSSSVRLGPVLRKVNRTMWDTYKNPLGLVYSLYRGVDCFIDWPKPG